MGVEDPPYGWITSATVGLVEKLAEKLTKVQYRPGYEFSAIWTGRSWAGAEFKLKARVVNAYLLEGPPLDITFVWPIVDAVLQTIVEDDQAFLGWLKARLLEHEEHELGEFLVVADARPFDPHRNDRRQWRFQAMQEDQAILKKLEKLVDQLDPGRR